MGRPRYMGTLRESTKEGFKQLVVDLNVVAREGYRVIHIAPLGNQIGALFEYQGSDTEEAEDASPKKRGRVYENFFE